MRAVQSAVKHLAMWCRRRGRYRVIGAGHAKGPLLIRFYILHFRLFAACIHLLLRSDEDRCLHDHPWPFVSLIVEGGYREHTVSGARDYAAGAVLCRRATHLHRVELRRPTWTLVLMGPQLRQWGFRTARGWVPFEEYSGDTDC